MSGRFGSSGGAGTRPLPWPFGLGIGGAGERGDGHRQVDARRARGAPERGLVVALEHLGELRILVRRAVHERPLRALDDGLDVVAGDRLVGLERVGDRQDLGAVLREELRGDLATSPGASPRRACPDRSPGSCGRSRPRPWPRCRRRSRASTTPWEATVSPMRPVPEHPRRHRRRAPHVAAHAGRVVAVEEQPFPGERGQAHDDVGSRSERHWTNWSSGGIEETKPPTSPRRSIVAMSITHVPAGPVGGDRVARLVDRRRRAARGRRTRCRPGGRAPSAASRAMTSAQLMTSRPSRIAITSASFTMSWMLAPVRVRRHRGELVDRPRT